MSPPKFGMLRLAVFSLVLLAAPPPFARATVYTLRADGTGDFPTIQAAVDSLFATADTLLLAAGHYNEIVDLTASHYWYMTIIGLEGRDSTLIKGFTFNPASYGPLQVVGVTIVTTIYQVGHGSSWTGCRFANGFMCSTENSEGPTFNSCEFHGRSYLLPQALLGFRIADCTFREGTTTVAGAACCMSLVRCTFEDCDTALIVRGDIDDGVGLSHCTFRRVNYAVVGPSNADNNFGLSNCYFELVSRAAVIMIHDFYTTGRSLESSVAVFNSVFRQCAAGIRINSQHNVRVYLAGLRFDDCVGRAIDVQGHHLDLADIEIDGAGEGVVARRNRTRFGGFGEFRNLRITNTGGSGLVVSDTLIGERKPLPLTIMNCLLAGNRDAGLVVGSTFVAARFNQILDNGEGARFDLQPGESLSISHNTIARNAGTGLQVIADEHSAAAPVTIENNIVALGGGKGIQIIGGYCGNVWHNDAWMNAGGDLSGIAPDDTNLVADPLFCGVAMEDFRLNQLSPCAPSGPYGLIGALGVGCQTTSTVASLTSVRVESGVVQLQWHVINAANTALAVERRTEDLDWVAVGPAIITGQDRVAFADFDVVAGRRYGYRLADGSDIASAETWVDVPSLAFALHGCQPNPSGPTPMVAFTLATEAPATLALFDLSGRRIAGRTLMGLGTGHHLLAATPEQRLSPGVYWVSLCQGRSSAVTRVVVVR